MLKQLYRKATSTCLRPYFSFLDERKVTAAADRKKKSRNSKLAPLKQWNFIKCLRHNIIVYYKNSNTILTSNSNKDNPDLFDWF